MIVGGEWGVSEFFLRFQSYSLGNSGPHTKFKNRSLSPSGLFLFSWKEGDGEFVDNKGFSRGLWLRLTNTEGLRVKGGW